MMKARTLLALAAIACASAAHAQEQALPQGAWAASDDRITLTAAGISLPRDLGPVSLSSTGEFSRKGEGVDNFAQFSNEAETIQGTAYIYLPTYADAALTAYMTERVILERFGEGTTRIAQSSVPAAGRDGIVIRNLYRTGDGRPTTAAFLRVGGWIVKLRATGLRPGTSEAEVTAVLDALIGGITVAERRVHAARHCALRYGLPRAARQTRQAGQDVEQGYRRQCVDRGDHGRQHDNRGKG